MSPNSNIARKHWRGTRILSARHLKCCVTTKINNAKIGNVSVTIMDGMIHQNECAACGDALAAAADQQQQQCVHCSERFCSARCALIGAPPVAVRAASYVRLLDTNYID